MNYLKKAISLLMAVLLVVFYFPRLSFAELSQHSFARQLLYASNDATEESVEIRTSDEEVVAESTEEGSSWTWWAIGLLVLLLAGGGAALAMGGGGGGDDGGGGSTTGGTVSASW